MKFNILCIHNSSKTITKIMWKKCKEAILYFGKPLLPSQFGHHIRINPKFLWSRVFFKLEIFDQKFARICMIILVMFSVMKYNNESGLSSRRWTAPSATSTTRLRGACWAAGASPCPPSATPPPSRSNPSSGDPSSGRVLGQFIQVDHSRFSQPPVDTKSRVVC